MRLGKAINDGDIEGIIEVVDEAVSVYGAAKPAPIIVETAYGGIPFDRIFDKDTKLELIRQAYAGIVRASAEIGEDADLNVEVAKLIATNAVLRNVSKSVANSADGFL